MWIIIAYLYKRENPITFTSSNLFNSWEMFGVRRGDSYYHPISKGEYMDRGPLSWCKLCGEVRHQSSSNRMSLPSFNFG